MTKVTADISVSLDGFVAGPNASLELPLGENGELLHEWVFGLAGWRRRHREEGGETGIDDDVLEEANRATGAVVMGRGIFSGGTGAWEDDAKASGWWGDDPPFTCRSSSSPITRASRSSCKAGRLSRSLPTVSSRQSSGRAQRPATATSSWRVAAA
jgi:hypothetical protein